MFQHFFLIFFFFRNFRTKCLSIFLGFSSNRPTGPIRSSSRDVRCMSVWCPFCPYTHLCICLPPLPEVGCPKFLEIRNPWGKVMERSGLRYEHFCLKIVENRVTKKSFFSPLFSLFFDLLRFSVFFNGLFAPTSRSWMSNIFTDSESLGKSNGKKWSHTCTFLFGSGLKSPRKKKFFFLPILFYKTWTHGICMDARNLHGRTEFAWTHGICMDAPLNLHAGVVEVVSGGSVINGAYPV